MKHALHLLAITSAMFFSSCEKGEPNIDTGKDLVLTPVEQEKVVQGNYFAFELFRQSTEGLATSDNALLSPLSVSMALAMVNNGSGGETRKAIDKTMKWEDFDISAVNIYYQKLMEDLPMLDPLTTLGIANSVWHVESLRVLPEFVLTNSEYYKAETAALDFRQPSAPDNINDWVNAKTNGRIPSIVERIPDSILMYLINAIYFKGAWEQKFDPSATAKGTFNRAGNNPLETDFMKIVRKFNVSHNEHLEAIELPYGNKKYTAMKKN